MVLVEILKTRPDYLQIYFRLEFLSKQQQQPNKETNYVNVYAYLLSIHNSSVINFISEQVRKLMAKINYSVGVLSFPEISDPTVKTTALKYLIYLLPVPNRDTLKALLDCLFNVAASAEDTFDDDGNVVSNCCHKILDIFVANIK